MICLENRGTELSSFLAFNEQLLGLVILSI